MGDRQGDEQNGTMGGHLLGWRVLGGKGGVEEAVAPG